MFANYVDGHRLKPIQVRVIAPPKDIEDKQPKTKTLSATLSVAAAASSSDPIGGSVGSVYAGDYTSQSTSGKYPVRIVTSSASGGTFTLTRYGTPQTWSWTFGGPGEITDVIDGPQAGMAPWTLIKSGGGTHVLSPNSPSKLKINDILMHSGPTYVAQPRAKLTNSNLFLAVDTPLVLLVEPGPGWASNNTLRTDQLYEWKVDGAGISASVSNTFSWTSPGTHVVSVSCHSPATPVIQSLTIQVMRVDLDADTDLDGDIDDADEASENVAGEPGRVVGVNNDTHTTAAGNDEVDHADEIINGATDKSKDLKILRLKFDPNVTTGDYILRCPGNSCVRIFDGSDTAVLGPAAGTEHTIAASSVCGTEVDYLVEAIVGGQEVTVELAYRPVGGGEVCSDIVKVTTVGMSAAGAFYIGSLNRSLAVNVTDGASGQPTDKFYVGVSKLQYPENPAYVIVNLKNLVTETTLAKLKDGTYKIMNETVFVIGVGVPLEESIKTDPMFIWLLNFYQLFDPFMTVDELYDWTLASFGIFSQDEAKYYWVLPKIYTTGSQDFAIRKGTGGETIKRINLTVMKVDIEVNNTSEQTDDIICRYSTSPAGRPTIPCRARIQGLGSGNKTIVLTSSKLRFPNVGDTSKTLSLPASGTWVPFDISGQSESTTMNDALIEAHFDTAGGMVCGSEDLTVLWVKNMTLRNTQDAGFSTDNASTLKPNPTKLGKQQLIPPPTVPTITHVVELKGEVFPNNFNQNVKLIRDNIDDFQAMQLDPNPPVVLVNNTGIARGVGEGNDPTDPGWRDDDVQPNGNIYDIDTPGFQTGAGSLGNGNPQGTKTYIRMNFLQYGIFNGVRCSDDLQWYIRLTTEKTGLPGDGTYIHLTRPGHADDNTTGTGSTTMTVD